MRHRRGLLATVAATVAVAVATIVTVSARLDVSAARTLAEVVDPDPAAVATGRSALAAAGPALILAVAVVAVLAGARLGRLVAMSRAEEDRALRARGLSSAQARVLVAAEALVVAAVGGIAGVAVAALWGLVDGSAPAVLAQTPWAVVAVVLLALTHVVAAEPGRRGETARRALTAGAGLGLLGVAAATALVAWQLPAARAAGGDPIVTIAPTTLLVSAAVVVLAGVALAAWIVAGLGARARGFSPSYPARQVARRLPVFAVAVLLVALTSAQVASAAAFSGTWQRLTDTSAAVRSGADLRVDTEPRPVRPADVVATTEVDGIRAAAAALVQPITFGDLDSRLLGLPVHALDDVVTAGGELDEGALAALDGVDAAAGAESLALPEAAAVIEIAATGTVRGPLPRLQLSAVLIDAAGTPATLTLADAVATAGAAGAMTWTFEQPLPSGHAPWRLLAVSATVPASLAGGEADLTELRLGADVGTIEAAPTTIGAGGSATLWLTGTDLAAFDEPQPVAGVVTASLARALGVDVGDTLDFRYDGMGREGSLLVAAVTPALPGAGTDPAVLTGLEQTAVAQLQRGSSIVAPTSIWAAGDVAAAAALRDLFAGADVTTAEPPLGTRIVGGLVPAWLIATAGIIVLALLATVAIVQTLAAARRREAAVLRALGVSAARQARARTAELAGVLGAALVGGAVIGAAVSLLLTPGLVRATTPGILDLPGVGVAFDPLVAVAGLLALALGLGVISAVAGSAAGRHARSALVDEEAR